WDARDVMGEAEQGQLAVRAPAEESDELGFLEKSFNRMLGEIGATISTVQREADEVAAFAEQLAASAEELHATSETVTHTAHLLALNAAIEAARAEEHGEGFAVVADEVRSLAGEAGKSAREVAELVSELRAGIDAAARAMQSGEAKVRDIGAVAAEADSALQE